MSEVCCREKYLKEYIAELNIEERVKRRMLDMCEYEEREKAEAQKYLMNCRRSIDELEHTVIELGIELAKAKAIIRENGL